jgi:hypothetical protein
MSLVLLSAFLIRNRNVSGEDDKIYVRKNDDTLLVKYYDGHSKKNYELNLGNTPLECYVKNLCKMFKTDTDPFVEFQLNFHGFPTYMVTQAKMTDDTISMLQEVSTIVSNSAFDDDMPELIPYRSRHCCENN